MTYWPEPREAAAAAVKTQPSGGRSSCFNVFCQARLVYELSLTPNSLPPSLLLLLPFLLSLLPRRAFRLTHFFALTLRRAERDGSRAGEANKCLRAIEKADILGYIARDFRYQNLVDRLLLFLRVYFSE